MGKDVATFLQSFQITSLYSSKNVKEKIEARKSKWKMENQFSKKRKKIFQLK